MGDSVGKASGGCSNSVTYFGAIKRYSAEPVTRQLDRDLFVKIEAARRGGGSQSGLCFNYFDQAGRVNTGYSPKADTTPANAVSHGVILDDYVYADPNPFSSHSVRAIAVEHDGGAVSTITATDFCPLTVGAQPNEDKTTVNAKPVQYCIIPNEKAPPTYVIFFSNGQAYKTSSESCGSVSITSTCGSKSWDESSRVYMAR